MSTPSDQETAPDAAPSATGPSDAAPPDAGSDATPDGPPVDPRSRGERFEQSRRGRLVIGLFLAVTLAALVVINAPETQTKRAIVPAAAHYLSALGLEQGWGVFAPNPRRFSLDVWAELLQRDGTTRVVPVIEAGRGVTQYWDYRWQRWGDRLATGPDNEAMWEPFCQWVARQDREAGGTPIRCSLHNLRADTLPPGEGPSRAEPNGREFFAVGIGS